MLHILLPDGDVVRIQVPKVLGRSQPCLNRLVLGEPREHARIDGVQLIAETVGFHVFFQTVQLVFNQSLVGYVHESTFVTFHFVFLMHEVVPVQLLLNVCDSYDAVVDVELVELFVRKVRVV